MDLAANMGIISKSGSLYQYGSEKIGQGREQSKLYLAEHAKLFKEIEAKVKEKIEKDNKEKEIKNSPKE